MKRSELIMALLDDIVNRISPTAEWHQDYEIAKSIGLREAVDHCALIAKKTYAKVIEYLQNYVNTLNDLNQDEELSTPQCYTLSVKNNQAQKRKFKKLRTDSDPYIFTLDIFGDSSHISISDNNWAVWERIWCSIANDATEKNKFWRELSSSNRSLIYIQTDEPDITPAKKWNIYSYAYLKFVNDGKFPIPEELHASELSPIYTPLNYNGLAKYEQFFDVYDVLNEVKHSPDELTRFMKVYQVVELLAYRMKFQNLIKEHIEHQYPIVRKIESLIDRLKKSEMDEIVSLFKTQFPNIANQLDPQVAQTHPAEQTYLNNDCTRFIDEKYGIGTTGNGVHPAYSSQKIGEIVYKIRCSIVHNKETEFHYTYNNLEEYKDIVPLIKKLNELLLAYIIEIINQGNSLVYTHDKLTLY